MFANNELMKNLGIEVVQLHKEEVTLKMPVDKRTHQPAGFLHGGASVLLAETAASIGAFLNVDQERDAVFGVEINANHLKSKRDGVVTAIATPIRIGRTTHVWNIDIKDEDGAMICISRCTIGVVGKRK